MIALEHRRPFRIVDLHVDQHAVEAFFHFEQTDRDFVLFEDGIRLDLWKTKRQHLARTKKLEGAFERRDCWRLPRRRRQMQLDLARRAPRDWQLPAARRLHLQLLGDAARHVRRRHRTDAEIKRLKTRLPGDVEVSGARRCIRIKILRHRDAFEDDARDAVVTDVGRAPG